MSPWTIIGVHFKKHEEHVHLLFIIHFNRKVMAHLFVCVGTNRRIIMDEKDKKGYGLLGQKGVHMSLKLAHWERKFCMRR